MLKTRVRVLLAALTLAVPAIADASCGSTIIEDFADNYAIDGTYTQACYDDALARVPADFANYSNVIPAIRAAKARDAAPPEPEPAPVSEPAPATAAATPAKPKSKPPKKTKPKKRRNQSAVTTSSAGATTSAPVVATESTPASTAAEEPPAASVDAAGPGAALDIIRKEQRDGGVPIAVIGIGAAGLLAAGVGAGVAASRRRRDDLAR